jgi:biotin operon repressor
MEVVKLHGRVKTLIDSKGSAMGQRYMSLTERVKDYGGIKIDWTKVYAVVDELDRRGITRGDFQRDIAEFLLGDGQLLDIAGDSDYLYMIEHQKSLESLIERLRDEGFDIEYRPGPKKWSGVYILRGIPDWVEDLIGTKESVTKRKYTKGAIMRRRDISLTEFRMEKGDHDGIKLSWTDSVAIADELERRRVVRGAFQRDTVQYFLSRGKIYASAIHHVRGRAGAYLDKYQQSIDSLIKRLQDAGFDIEYQLGPRGGKWTAVYILRGLPDWAQNLIGTSKSTLPPAIAKRENEHLAETVLKLNRALRRLFLEQTVADLGETPRVPADDEDALVEPEIDTYELETEMNAEVYRDLYQTLVDAIRAYSDLDVQATEDGMAIGSEDGYAIVKFVVLNGEPLIQWQLPSGTYSFTLAPQVGTVESVDELINRLSDEDHIEAFISMIKDGFTAGEVELEVGGEEEDFFDELPEGPMEEPTEEPSEPDVELPSEEEPMGPPEGEEEGETSEFEPGEEESEEEEETEEEEEPEEEEEEATESRVRRRFRLHKRMKEQAEPDADALAKRVLKSFDFPDFYKKFEPREGQPDIISFVSQPANTAEDSDESIT